MRRGISPDRLSPLSRTSGAYRRAGMRSIQTPLGELGTLCSGHTLGWAVRHHAAFDAPETFLREFWHRRPIDLDSGGAIFCGHPRWKAVAKLGLSRVPGHVSRDQAVETSRIQTHPPVEAARLRRST